MCMYGPHAWNRRRVSRARTSLHRSWPRVVRCPAPGAGPPARYAPAAACGCGARPWRRARPRGGGALAETRRPRSVSCVVRPPSTFAHRGVGGRAARARAAARARCPRVTGGRARSRSADPCPSTLHSPAVSDRDTQTQWGQCAQDVRTAARGAVRSRAGIHTWSYIQYQHKSLARLSSVARRGPTPLQLYSYRHTIHPADPAPDPRARSGCGSGPRPAARRCAAGAEAGARHA